MDYETLTGLVKFMDQKCNIDNSHQVFEVKANKKLYENILQGKTENDTIESQYRSKEVYRVYKQRFTDTLIELIALNKFKPSLFRSRYQKDKIKIFRKYFVGHSLVQNGFRDLGISILKTIIPSCQKNEYVHQLVHSASELYEHSGLHSNSSRVEFLKAKKLFQVGIELQTLHFKSLEFYVELGRKVISSKSYQIDESLISIEKELKLHLKLIDTIDNYQIRFYSYNAAYYLNLLKGDSKEQIKLIEKAIIYFKKKEQFKSTAIFSFTQKKALHLLLYGNTNDSRKLLFECISIAPKNNILVTNIPYGYIFTTYVLDERYADAVKIMNKVLRHKDFKIISNAFREPWYLKEAFIHFLIRTGKINPQDFPDIKLRMFRLNRFLNEVPVYSKDKKGINITINIIQILFLLSDKKYDTVIDKLNSLKQYNHRYLRKSQYIRSNCFIKMLLTIPVGHFNKKLVQTRADKYYQKLLLNPMDYSEQSLNIEIIPYERLWEEVLSILE